MSEVSSITTTSDDLEPTKTSTDNPNDIKIRQDNLEDAPKRFSDDDEYAEKRTDDIESTASKTTDFDSVTTKVNEYESITAKTPDYESIISRRHDSQSRLVWEDEEERMTRPRRWRKSLRLTWSRYGDNWWPEVAALCLSFACTWAMVIVLQQYDGKEAPRLPFQLTLNAIISILATTSKVSLMYLVSNAFGQTKWVWFGKRSRNLLDAEIFDDASRGPLGALHLLSARTRTSVLGSLGAILTLLALVYDPFVQQIVVVQPLYSPSTNAVLNRTAFFNISATDFSSVAALNAGLWGSGGQRSVNCSSANCRWDLFTSLEWFSSCTDVARSFTEPCSFADAFQQTDSPPYTNTWNKTCTLTPIGYSSPEVTFQLSGITYFEPLGNQSQANIILPMRQIVKQNDTFADLGVSGTSNTNFTSEKFVPVGSMPFISFSSTTFDYDAARLELSNAKTVTCSLELCARRSNLSVFDGGVVLQYVGDPQTGSWSRQVVPGAVSTPYGFDISDWYYCWAPKNESSTFNISRGVIDGGVVTAGNDSSVAFCIPPPQSSDFWDWNSQLPLEGNSNTTLVVEWFSSDQANVQNGSDIGNPPFLPTPDNNIALQNLVATGVNITAQNLASSLTQLNLRMNPSMLYGTSESSNSYVHVRPVWLIMPILLPCSCLLFLMAIMWESYRSSTPLWKSSVNALFYHGIDHMIGVNAPLEKVSQLDAQAALTSARLAPTGRDDRLVLESSVVRLTP